jgi:1-acyl-sn-glycerol-3-phosphate acyltransferase
MASHHWNRPELFYHFVVAPPVRLFVWALAEVRIVGTANLPRRGPVVVAANHVSRLDPFVLAVACYRLGRTARFLAVQGLFETPFVGWLLRWTRMIPVVRGGGAERLVADALPALAAGQLVLVYPEGTIPPPGETLPGGAGGGRRAGGRAFGDSAAAGAPRPLPRNAEELARDLRFIQMELLMSADAEATAEADRSDEDEDGT